jgi:hypothetical protein
MEDIANPSRWRSEVEFSRHLRHDPQLLKILFAEDRHVRPALMILSQCDITADERA